MKTQQALSEGTYWTFGFLQSPAYFQVQTASRGVAPVLPRVRGIGGWIEYRLRSRGGLAILEWRRVRDDSHNFVHVLGGPSEDWQPLYELAPSNSTPEDWDLTACYGWAHRNDGDAESPERTELAQPIPSFLIHLEDPRAREYLDALGTEQQAPDPTRARELATALATEHPRDAAYALFAMDHYIRAGETARLKVSIEGVRPAINDAPPSLRFVFRKAEHALRALELNDGDRNFLNHVDAYDHRGSGAVTSRSVLDQIVEDASEVWKFAGYARPDPILDPQTIPNFIESQIDAKVRGVVSQLLMLKGDREQALELSLTTYRIGQLLIADGPLIQILVGTAIRHIALRPLEVCVLNAFTEASELEQVWTRLEQLEAGELPYLRERVLRLEMVGVLTPEQTPPWMNQNMDVVEAPYRVADAHFQLLRTAVAARQCLLRTGALPVRDADFGPLLAAIPSDPFTSQPLRFARSPGEIVIYSLGPDMTDDGGLIAYDPTNGTHSRGDLAIHLAPQRQYPFPPEGVRARTREELLSGFPNGLPPDPFANERGAALRVSPTSPVHVFSWGPDSDESIPDGPGSAPRSSPEAPYDPTNGVISDGDLVLRIPLP